MPGLSIPDDATFAAQPQSDSTTARIGVAYNVNTFIKMLYNTVHSIKPWVKFGVSPFGIYHNLSSGGSVPGSDTRGLQNYDDLYADVLFWVGQGWVDYVVPQLYWPIGHSSADYDRLLRWWAKHAAGRPLYIGQDVERTVSKADLNNPTVNQMNAKFELQRSFPSVQGHVIWYSAAVVRNEGNYAYELQNNYHLTPALVPQMPSSTTKPRRRHANSKPCGCPTATISLDCPESQDRDGRGEILCDLLFPQRTQDRYQFVYLYLCRYLRNDVQTPVQFRQRKVHLCGDSPRPFAE